MGWVVDTCVLIDVLDEDARYGKASAVTLQGMLSQGLVVSPISFIELSPAFMGDLHAQRLFLDELSAAADFRAVFPDLIIVDPGQEAESGQLGTHHS
ncbi:hypothetical protein [Desulfonatronum lacustre]|uniref:hypothetical protein n=1 Tax=Desulfonatronum lacustre TaxID=66849 RepID=UPI0004ACF280|nr:hypothetical protein [Desulfonatronum lacustre]